MAGVVWAGTSRINEKGQVCGLLGSAYGSKAGLYDPEKGTTVLNPSPGVKSVALDLNDAAHVVGWMKRNEITAISIYGFVWDAESGMRRLDELLDASSVKDIVKGDLRVAFAINNKGQIAAVDNGSVLLTPFLLGDLDCDGFITSEDVYALLQLLQKPPAANDPAVAPYAECGWWAGDMNQDAKLTVEDLPLLLAKIKD